MYLNVSTTDTDTHTYEQPTFRHKRDTSVRSNMPTVSETPLRKKRIQVVHMQHKSNEPVEPDRIADEPLSSQIARNCLLTRARQISRVLTSVYDDALRPFGIVAPQFSLLVLIAEFGPMTRSDLGRRNYQERSTLTRNLQPLIGRGWVAEGAPPSDGRSRPLSLTHEGNALLKNAASAWAAAQSHATRLLGEASAPGLMNIARKLPLRIV